MMWYKIIRVTVGSRCDVEPEEFGERREEGVG